MAFDDGDDEDGVEPSEGLITEVMRDILVAVHAAGGKEVLLDRAVVVGTMANQSSEIRLAYRHALARLVADNDLLMSSNGLCTITESGLNKV